MNDFSGYITQTPVDGSTESLPLKNGTFLCLSLSGNEILHTNDQFALILSGEMHYSGNRNISAATAFLSAVTKLESVSDAINQAKGAFSLVLVDMMMGNVHLVVDKFGTHPLYYAYESGRICFSNKLNNIIRIRPELKVISQQSIYQYIYFHCIPAPDTIYQQVFKVQAGQCVRIEKNTAKVESYYVPDFTPSTDSSETLKSKLFIHLESSVKNAMEGLNPEKTGAFLSGGLDSSTVSGFFSRFVGPHKAKTFTIGFHAQGYDESEFAKITADHFQTDHSVYYLTPDNIGETLKKIAAYYDEPFGNSSALPAYYCAKFAGERGVEVMLAGDGGDELFAGNDRYAKQKIFEWYFKIPGPLRALFIELPLNMLPAERIPGIKKVASYVRQAKVRLPARLQTYNFLKQFKPEEVFNEAFLAQVDPDRPDRLFEARYNEPSSGDAQNRMLYLDWKFTLADNDLVKVNNMVHLAGLQVRYPMLDDDLVELSTRIPSETLLPGNQLRAFYKEATTGFLSDKTINKTKKGFGLPFGVWLRERAELKTMAYENVRNLKQYGFFKESFLEHAIKMHSSEHPGYFGELIWILMMLNLWLEAH